MDKTLQNDVFKWFLDNYDRIYREYGKCYVAIKNKKILGIYNSAAEGIRETKKSEEIGSFIVQYCNGEESGYTNYISSMNFMGAVG